MINAESLMHSLEMLMYTEVISIKDERTALRCVDVLFDCLYLNFKTRLMYIPSRDHSEAEKEYDNIYQDYINNYSYQDLAAKYHRSAQNIYAITKLKKNQHIKKHQTDLFSQKKEDSKKPITLIVIEEYLPHELLQKNLLSEDESKIISNKISKYILATYPGVSITISNTMKNNRADQNQTSLF